MRIRRYAARLLSSSATGNPGSPPPQPAADDCSAFCDLVHAFPQESADSFKHKGHIADRVPESDAKSGERVGPAQGPPAPGAKKCKIHHGPSFTEVDVGLGAANGGPVVSEAAVKLEDGRLAPLIDKDDVNPALKAGPFVANVDSVEQEVKCGCSLENGRSSELEILKVAPHTEKVAFDPEATERVSLESRAPTLPRVTGIELDVTGEESIMNESGEELGAPRTASTEPEITEGISQMSKTVINAGATIPVPDVTRTASLSSEGSVQPEITGKASLVQGATELEATEGPVASETAQEPEDSGRRITCSADDDPALHEALHPIFNTIGNVKAGNAGETVAAAMQPSHYDADASDGNDSVSHTSNSPVAAKDPTVEGGVARNSPVADNGVLYDRLEEYGTLDSNGPGGLVTHVDLVAAERLEFDQNVGAALTKFLAEVSEAMEERELLLGALAQIRLERSTALDRAAGLEEELKTLRAAHVSADIAVAAARKERDAAVAEARKERDTAVAEASMKFEAIILQERSQRELAETMAQNATNTALLAQELTRAARAEKSALEAKLADAEETLQWTRAARDTLQTSIDAAAAELEVDALPVSSFAERIREKVTSLRDRIKGALHFGVRTAFSVFATHYEIDRPSFDWLGTGYVSGYDEDDLKTIREKTDEPADALAAQFEEEVLPESKKN